MPVVGGGGQPRCGQIPKCEDDGFVRLGGGVARDGNLEARLFARRCRRHDGYIHRPVGDVRAVIRRIATRSACTRSRDIERNLRAPGRNGELPGGVKQDSVDGWIGCIRIFDGRRFGRGKTDGLRMRGNVDGVAVRTEADAGVGSERIPNIAEREFDGFVPFGGVVAINGENDFMGERGTGCPPCESDALLRVGECYIITGCACGASAACFVNLDGDLRGRRTGQTDGNPVFDGGSASGFFNDGGGFDESDGSDIVVGDG